MHERYAHLCILGVQLISSWVLGVNAVASKEAQDGSQQTGVVVEQDRQQCNKHAAIQLSCSGLP